jgi:hypothetical protein
MINSDFWYKGALLYTIMPFCAQLTVSVFPDDCRVLMVGEDSPSKAGCDLAPLYRMILRNDNRLDIMAMTSAHLEFCRWLNTVRLASAVGHFATG